MRELIVHGRQIGAFALTFCVMICLTMAVVVSSESGATPLSPPAPTLASPRHNSWTNNPDVLFVWSESDGAVSYELRYVKRDSCVIDPEDPSVQAEQFMAADVVTAVSLEPNLRVHDLAEGVWCWQVRAVGHVGGHGSWSEPKSFTVDTTQPLLVIKQLTPQERLLGTVDEKATITLILDGTVRPEVLVSVSAVPSDSKTYDWSLTLPELPSGDHTYALRAIDAAGNEKDTASVKFVSAVDTSGGVTDTQHEMLPLVPAGPLVFIASPPREPTDIETMAPIIDTSSTRAVAIEAPTRIERLARSDVLVSHTPVQATEKGWQFFGVVWYWWALGVSLSVVVVWVVLARIQLATRLNWISAV